MLTTQFVPGSPCWIELDSPNIDVTERFYGGLFGWEFQEQVPEYAFCQIGGRTVAGIGALMGEAVTSAWIPYFQVRECEATTRAIELAGGAVLMPPVDLEPQGEMAQFDDPAGARFAIWRPAGIPGVELVNEPGSLAWIELHVPDTTAIRGFYESVFGWRFEDVPMGDTTYALISPAGCAPGADPSVGGVTPLGLGDRPHWLAYFAVSDCDATVAGCRELGGTVHAPAEDVKGVGRMALLVDPHDARFAVVSGSP
ncbi:VOC family protein [Nonomuraea cavernae]|uniref:Hydroxylase n=1 Tax=Nonomuraea cavernae TaxID=2045107 RepID=A0A917ZDE6_9ACTN|nr:VOC family protein [Nonomuraea cavernae]MCA2190370.1 VOC family protein [Nonomuraea cavernae]GGO80783.1 hydroxylase [Nonomuraea cavernae]